MRKRKIGTLALVAMLATANSTVFAKAGTEEIAEAGKGKYCCIAVDKTDLKIGKLCDGVTILTNQMGNLDSNNCIYDIIIAEGCIPGLGKPETDTPEVEKPETDTPEVEKPETDIPELEKPEAGTPDNEAPEMEEETQDTTYVEQVVKLVNEERKKAGLSELTLDKSIEAAAHIRAKEIEQLFSHIRPNGSAFATVLKEQGISYTGAGENIAWGQATPEEVMRAWMNSDGHRANILNSKFTKIGVGFYQNSKGVKHWTQLFTY